MGVGAFIGGVHNATGFEGAHLGRLWWALDAGRIDEEEQEDEGSRLW